MSVFMFSLFICQLMERSISSMMLPNFDWKSHKATPLSFHFPTSSPFPLSRKLKKVSIYSPYTTSFMRCSLAISDIINLCLLLWPPLFWWYVAQKERSRKMKGNMLSGGPKHSKKFNHFLKKNWVACFNFLYFVSTV